MSGNHLWCRQPRMRTLVVLNLIMDPLLDFLYAACETVSLVRDQCSPRTQSRGSLYPLYEPDSLISLVYLSFSSSGTWEKGTSAMSNILSFCDP